jgi:hypothetical protein
MEPRPRSLLWRLVPVGAVLVVSLIAFDAGVGVTERPGITGAVWPARLYYALSLFVLGGVDIGVPVGGPNWARNLLWLSYFLAPAVTTGAVVEGVLRILRPQMIQRVALRDHIVLAGVGRTGLLYLERLRSLEPHRRVVVLDLDPSQPTVQEAASRFGAIVLPGDITHKPTRHALRLHRAAALVLLTGDDLANLAAAWDIGHEEPDLPIAAHVADLSLKRSVAELQGEVLGVHVFNSHHLAARELWCNHLKQHFADTRARDVVVLAGFGRFGQTILEYLCQHAPDELQHVVVVDRNGPALVRQYQGQMGAPDGFRMDVLAGDLTDPGVWPRVEGYLEPEAEAPVFVLGVDGDSVNLSAALGLRSLHPEARLFVRCFHDSEFTQSLATAHQFDVLGLERMLRVALGSLHERLVYGPSLQRGGRPVNRA